MKKIVSIVLVIALLVSTVGCGASGDKFDKLKDKTAHTAETVANAAILVVRWRRMLQSRYMISHPRTCSRRNCITGRIV